MEYQGIITGIGDKEQNKNLIKPEYDAALNDFIIGKNTILEGLVLNGKNISAGTCILCGYRGIIDMPKELDNTTYVYGKFTLNSIYGGSGEDDFDIVGTSTELTANVNPTEITSAGTYYLLLYANGVEQIDREHSYPKYSQQSAETDYVGDNVVISETATTPTETNELGEIETDLHLSQPNRVANTEYVHNQIEEEIDYDMLTMNFVASLLDDISTNIGTITIERKAKYCVGNIDIDSSKISPAMLASDGGYTFYGEKDLDGFIPVNDIVFTIILSATAITSARRICVMETKNGKIKLKSSISASGSGVVGTSFGYQCQ